LLEGGQTLDGTQPKAMTVQIRKRIGVRLSQ